MAICHLCKEDKVLIKAHVIPQALYPNPNDVGGIPRIASANSGVYPKKVRIGIYDPNILCESCDGKLGILDQYFVENVLRKKPTRVTIKAEGLLHQYDGSDGATVHSFLISVLWRASVSSHSFFRRVELGRYADGIRSQLLGNANCDSAIESFISEFDINNVPILDPHFTRLDGVRVWIIYANRFIMYVKTDRRAMPVEFRGLTLTGGLPVKSIVRPWKHSKERLLHLRVAEANPNLFA